MEFNVNNNKWKLIFVNPNSSLLKRSDGSTTVGMTDLNTRCVYISNVIGGDFLNKVFKHELCHVYCMEFGIYFTPFFEEIFADALATYAESIIDKSNELCARCGKC